MNRIKGCNQYTFRLFGCQFLLLLFLVCTDAQVSAAKDETTADDMKEISSLFEKSQAGDRVAISQIISKLAGWYHDPFKKDEKHKLYCQNLESLLLKQTPLTLEIMSSLGKSQVKGFPGAGEDQWANALHVCMASWEIVNLHGIAEAVSKYRAKYPGFFSREDEFMYGEPTEWQSCGTSRSPKRKKRRANEHKSHSAVPGSDSCTAYDSAFLECLIYPNYVVWTNGGLDRDASYVAESRDPSIKAPQELKLLCEKGRQKNSWIYGGAVTGATGHYVLTDGGAGPVGLGIDDIETGKTILTATGIYETTIEKDGFVTYKGADVNPDPHEEYPPCGYPSDDEDVSATAFYRFRFNLKTHEKIKSPEFECLQ